MSEHKSHQFYKTFPKSCRSDDIWGQVKRTIGGKPVGDDQIAILVDTITRSLDLKRNDLLLDVCCGNGALSDLLFDRCRGGLGVDFSEYLIEIAKGKFERDPERRYELADAEAFVRSPRREKFTKALICSAVQYFEDGSVVLLLRDLRANFPGVQRVFLGNIPDLDRIDLFAPPEKRKPGIESDIDTAIGIWRTRANVVALAAEAGWKTQIQEPPSAYYAARYRFDAVLSV